MTLEEMKDLIDHSAGHSQNLSLAGSPEEFDAIKKALDELQLYRDWAARENAQYDAIIRIMDNPAPPTPKLVALMQQVKSNSPFAGIGHDVLVKRINAAVKVALDYGSTDGGHHKMWVIDQVLRELLEKDYEKAIAKRRFGEDGPETYSWDEGIAP